ncbi:MAG: hypothetical protein N2654_00270 [Deltaproteobacteria bacterium]|nr:hypothetical protein [Deltaproteobacteria bacterium]
MKVVLSTTILSLIIAATPAKRVQSQTNNINIEFKSSETAVYVLDKNEILKCSKSHKPLTQRCLLFASLPDYELASVCDPEKGWIAAVSKDSVILKNLSLGQVKEIKVSLGLNATSIECFMSSTILQVLIGNYTGYVFVLDFDPKSGDIKTRLGQLGSSTIRYLRALGTGNIVSCSADGLFYLANINAAKTVPAWENIDLISKFPQKKFAFNMTGELAACAFSDGILCGIDSESNFECFKLAGVKKALKGAVGKKVDKFFGYNSSFYFSTENGVFNIQNREKIADTLSAFFNLKLIDLPHKG